MSGYASENESRRRDAAFAVPGEFAAPPEPSPAYTAAEKVRATPGMATSFGLSLLLHLVALAAIPFLASTFLVRQPCSMVIDFTVDSCPPSASPDKGTRGAPVPVVKRVAPSAPPAVTEKTPVIPVRQPEGVAELTPEAAPTLRVAGETRATGAAPASTSPLTRETGSGGGEPSGVSGAGVGEATESARQSYLKQHFRYIRDLVASRVVYPAVARRMGWGGKVVVAFTVREDGSADNIRLVESSGIPILDRSALDTVRRASPFPRPPVRAEIVIPVQFRLL